MMQARMVSHEFLWQALNARVQGQKLRAIKLDVSKATIEQKADAAHVHLVDGNSGGFISILSAITRKDSVAKFYARSVSNPCCSA